MTKEQAKQLDEAMLEWFRFKLEMNFKNEDDEYRTMANFIGKRMGI